MRAVARLGGDDHGLYGRSPIEAARIDGFLDTSLVFARDSQIYLLALMHDELNSAIHADTAKALHHWLGGIEVALQATGAFIAGDELSLADICFAAETVLFANERTRQAALERHGLSSLTGPDLDAAFPRCADHFSGLVQRPEFAADIEPYLASLTSRQKQSAG